ncbi:RDD family protein [uncultured archaeon]|nr:RDD family protein [uncultured archaeon]
MDKISLASWQDRFWAWLIDLLLVGILWSGVMTISMTSAPSPAGLMILGSLLFIYWTALEGYRGQSLGKMLMNIVVVGPAGEGIGFRDSAIESFGKAFLLPLDCLVGWIAYGKSRQRAFNRFSNTIVADSRDMISCSR